MHGRCSATEFQDCWQGQQRFNLCPAGLCAVASRLCTGLEFGNVCGVPPHAWAQENLCDGLQGVSTQPAWACVRLLQQAPGCVTLLLAELIKVGWQRGRGCRLGCLCKLHSLCGPSYPHGLRLVLWQCPTVMLGQRHQVCRKVCAAHGGDTLLAFVVEGMPAQWPACSLRKLQLSWSRGRPQPFAEGR